MRSANSASVVRRTLSALLALSLGIGLAACATDPVAQQYRTGDNKGYITGDGRIVEYSAAQRGAPVSFAGTTEDGVRVSSADYAGKPLVVNFWYAACGPCRAEAPRLNKAASELETTGTAFLGVNIYDAPATAKAFEKTYRVTYHSVIDVTDKRVTQAFAAFVPLNSVPITLVLDRKGRVSARVIGELADASILTALVRTALTEKQ